MSERKSCRLAGVSRCAFRYARRRRAYDERVAARVVELSRGHPRYGYRRVHALLVREGWPVNEKRVHRIRKQEGLSLPLRRPKRRAYGPKGQTLHKATHTGHVWSYDFIEDRTVSGNKLRILTVLDEFTRECLAVRVERSLPARKVTQTLEWLFLLRGAPEHIRSDNGPEFVAKAVQEFVSARGSTTLYITPGSPWENGHVESFFGKLRDECLNREWFASGREAQLIAEDWRVEYNQHRPHSSLGYQTPAEFAARSERLRRASPSSGPPNADSAPILSL